MSEAAQTTSPEVALAPRVGRLLVAALAATATLLAALLVYSVSSQRAFQVDEVEHIHAAFHVAAGRVLYRDVFECHTPGLYLLLAPVIDADDPVASFFRARMVMLVLLLATIAFAARVAWHLRGAQAAWLVATALLVHSTFVERGMEVRPDGPLALAVTGALALATTRLQPVRIYVLQGLVMGLAFMFTQKSAIATVGFGLVWLGAAVKERNWRLVVWPCLAWAVPIVLVTAVFAALGALGPFLERNLLTPLGDTTRTRTNTLGFSPAPFLQQEGLRNPAFYAAALAGLAFATSACFTRPAQRGRLVPLVVVGWVSLVGLWINPYPFPYFHVPILAVLAPAAAALLPERWALPGEHALRRWAVALLVLPCLGWWSVPRISAKARMRADFQLEHLRRVQAITTDDETSFDLVGLYFRRDAYPIWVMTGPMLVRYAAGEYPPLIETLRRARPPVTTINYRTMTLPEPEREFLEQHYAHSWGNLFVLGFQLRGMGAGEERTIDVLAARTYRWSGAEGAIEVDGRPFVQGELTEGPHQVRAIQAIEQGALRIPTPWEHEAAEPPRFDLYVNFD